MSETATAGAAAAPATKRWWYVHLAGHQEVLTLLNSGPPAQGAGEMSATTRPDGSVDLYFFSAVGP